jgi:hypothetical protein
MGQWDTAAFLFLDFKFRPKSTTGGEPLPRRRGSKEGRARRAALQEAERLADLGGEEACARRDVVTLIDKMHESLTTSGKTDLPKAPARKVAKKRKAG